MICKICGKEFEPPKKMGRRPSVCSFECHCALEKKQLDKKRERARQMSMAKTRNEIGQEYKCPSCGNVFIKNHANQKYCSEECFKKHKSEANRVYSVRYHERHANAPKTPKQIDKEITPFSEIIAKCKEQGLSYGQYVQQYNL